MAERMRDSSAEVVFVLVLVVEGGLGVDVEVEVVGGVAAAAADVAVFSAVVGLWEAWPTLEATVVDALLFAAAVPVSAAIPAPAPAPTPTFDSPPNDNAANRLSSSSPVPAAAQNFIYRSTILS